jgi:hypothetical protein
VPENIAIGNIDVGAKVDAMIVGSVPKFSIAKYLWCVESE